jgi:DNA-binding GntR family transcriptional regulator
MKSSVEGLSNILKQQRDFFSITWFAERAGVSWTQAKLLLFQLMAEGIVDGQEIPRRGWIFRAKLTQAQIAVNPS